MKHPTNVSQQQKNQLAADLESEKDKIVAGKINVLHEKKMHDKKKKIAQTVADDEKRRKIYLRKAFSDEAKLARFIYRMRAWLVHIPAEEIYHNSLLHDLQSEIRRSSGDRVVNSKGMLSGKFIAQLYKAFLLIGPLSRILQTIFTQPKAIELYIKYAFKNMYKEVEMKREVSDFVNLAFLQDKIKMGGESLKEYVEEQCLEIRRYVKNIDPNFSAHLIKGLNDLYQLHLFAAFDYKKFFIAMGGGAGSLKSGNFADCSITAGLKTHLESFSYFVPMLSDIGNEASCAISRYSLACGTLILRKDEDQSLEHVEKVANKDEDNLTEQLVRFSKHWNNVICNYPFHDLIRLSSMNSFYEPKSYNYPTLKLKDRVKKCVDAQLLLELEMYIDKSHEVYNREAKGSLLIDYENSMLEYYSRDSRVNTGRFEAVPGFSHTEELNIIYNFVSKYYAENIKKIFSYLVRTLLPKGSDLRTIFINQSVAFENLEERIRNFDRELSPEKAWGKSLLNIVYRLEKNDTGNFITQIEEQLAEVDLAVEYLLEQAGTIFFNAVKCLELILTAENSKFSETLMDAKLPDFPQHTVLVRIENAIHAFNKIQDLVRKSNQ